jgi:hypothetical protein
MFTVFKLMNGVGDIVQFHLKQVVWSLCFELFESLFTAGLKRFVRVDVDAIFVALQFVSS